MATDSYLVYRWAHTVDSNNNVIGVDTGSGVSTSTISAGSYLNEGDGTSDDFIARFQTALQAAYAASGGTGTAPTAALNLNGHVVITGGSDTLAINWTVTNTVLPATLGFSGTSTAVPAGGSVTSAFQASNQWHPWISHVQWTRPVKATNRFSDRNLNGEPYNVEQGDGWYEEHHVYDQVKAARLFQGFSDEAAFAAVAGMATGEPNCLERLLDYALQTGSKSFYYYAFNTPGAHTRYGPVKLIAEEDLIRGLDARANIPSHSSPHYPVALHLWRADL